MYLILSDLLQLPLLGSQTQKQVASDFILRLSKQVPEGPTFQNGKVVAANRRVDHLSRFQQCLLSDESEFNGGVFFSNDESNAHVVAILN